MDQIMVTPKLCLGCGSCELACAVACPTGAIRFSSVPDYSKEKRQRYLTVFATEESQIDG